MEWTGLPAFSSKREKALQVLLKSNQDWLHFLETLKLEPTRYTYLEIKDPATAYAN